MASVRVDLTDARQGRLPRVCICCGAPAEQMVEHRFYYQPAWLILCNLILPAIVRWCLAYNSVVMPVPVCSRHPWRLKLPTLMGYLLAAVLLLMVPVLLFLSIFQYYGALLGLGLAALLLVLVTLPAILIAQLLTPRAYSISDLFVGLTSVSDEFAGFARRGSGLLGGSSSYTAPENGYVQPQPSMAPAGGAYGQMPPSTGAGAWKVVLIVGGSTLAAVLVIGVVIALAAMNRFSRAGRGPVAELPPSTVQRAGSGTEMPHSSSAAPVEFAPAGVPPLGLPNTFAPPAGVPPYQPPVDGSPPESVKTAAADAGSASSPPPNLKSSEASPADGAPTSISSSSPPARPRRGASSGRSAPPSGERPEPPVHALDLRTRKVVFPPNHGPIPDTLALAAGQEVWARQHDGPFWHKAFVVKVEGDLVTVRYKGWNDFFNESLAREMLCIDKSLAATAGSSSSGAVQASGVPSSDGSAAGKLRTWTDATGKYKVEAELVKVENGRVTLKKANGDLTTLPIEKLSDADRQFLSEDGFGK